MTVGGSLLDIPTWDQNRDPLPDGEPDPYHDTDCGEECAAMRIWHKTGIELPAGILRQLIPRHLDRGETSGPELVQLMRLFMLRPVYQVLALDAVLQKVARSTLAGVPPIVLGTWVAPSILHWVLVVDAPATGWVVNDPWGGQRRFLPLDLVAKRYAGGCIL